jgi:hypothetical protein
MLKTCASAIVLIAIVGFAGTAYMQGPSDTNGNPTILRALQALQGTVNTLQNTVNALGAATSRGNTRFTPPAFVVDPDFGVCRIVNVSAATQTVRVQIISFDGTLLSDTGDFSLGAGFETTASSGLLAGVFYCKFIAVSGSRTDIRGTLAVFPITASASDKLSLPAE